MYKTDDFLYCKGDKYMSVMNINLFSMKLKRMVDITMILPDEIKLNDNLQCLWFYYQNISAMDWLCYTSLADYVNEKYFAAIIPEIFEMTLQDNRYIIKELSMIIKNMFACISENEEDNFFDKEYYLEYEKDFDYTYNKIQDKKYKWELLNEKLLCFINSVLG